MATPQTDIEIDLTPENPDQIYRDYFTKTGTLCGHTSPINIPASFIYSEWHPNGIICSKEPFRNGKRHGLHYMYSRNGQLVRVEHYKHGQLHGLMLEFNENGDNIIKEYYIHGAEQ
jgi:antitoxin component YwqK of YwqJK toxin-antitoxin module